MFIKMAIKNIVFTFLILQIYLRESHSLDINFPSISKDFFDIRYYKYGTILACDTDFDLVKLFKNVSLSTGTRLSIKNLNSPVFQTYKLTKKIMTNLFTDPQIYHTAIILNADCPKSNEILKLASEMDIFDENRHWLLVGRDLTLVRNIFTPLNLRLDSNVWFALMSNAPREHWALYDFYNPGLKYGGKITITFYGLWFPDLKGSNSQISEKTPTNEFFLKKNCTENNIITYGDFQSNLEYFQNIENYREPTKYISFDQWRVYLKDDKIARRQNLMGITLDSVIAITSKPPKGDFMRYISTPVEVEKNTMHRYNHILYIILMDMYNFKMKIHRTNSWGYMKNGSWTGVMGFLVRKEAEISITPTQFKSERFHIVDQTAITWLARPAIIFRHPSRDTGLKEGFTKPLAPNVWYATLGVLVLITVLLRIALRHEARYFKPEGVQHSLEVKEDSSWSYTILLAVLSALFQQGILHSPVIVSGRTISLILLIFTFLLYQFYGASIVSSLLSEPPRTINTLYDLLMSDLKVLIEDIPYNYDFFETTTDPVAQRFYKSKVIPYGTMVNFVTPEVGLEKVGRGGYAFQVDIATAYKMIPETFSEMAVCDLAEVQLFPPKPVAPTVRKNSPYRQIITKGIRKMQEVGILHYQRMVWHHPRPRCPPSAHGGVSSVTISGAASALLLLALGSALALLIMIGEMFIARRMGFLCTE